MARHGYLREYDEGWDRGDDREREWRGREDRGRGFMFDDRDRERDRYRDRDEDRGFFSRMGNDARSWFEDDWRSGRGNWRPSDRGPQGESSLGRENDFGGREDHSFSSHPDDHYRSWRDRQMQSLDRDYQDYCREREQQFHQDFDSWRQNRQQSRASQQQQPSGSSEPVMELNNPTAESGETQGAGTSPTGAATLGTNNSENSTTGRGRR